MTNKLTAGEAQEIARLGIEDPAFFCRTFFPQWFPLQMPWVHRGVLAILSKQTDWLLKFGEEEWPNDKRAWTPGQLEKIIRYFCWQSEPEDPLSPLVPLFEAERDPHGNIAVLHLSVSDRMLFIMPRGISKTTLVNAYEIREIVNKSTDFLVYLSETATQAELQLETVKRELEGNILLQTIYGNKRPERTDSERWSQNWIETTDGIAVAAKGRGGQVRGLNHRGRRPNEIIFDDVEDKISVKTAEQRDQAATWLKTDVEAALPQVKSGDDSAGRLIGLGTVLHHDALLLRLARDPEWITVRFGAVGPGGNVQNPKPEDMLWEGYMTAPEYVRKRRSYIRGGMLGEFSMEYLSSIKQEGDGAKFQGPFSIVPRLHMEFPGRALVIDPAISDSKDSDMCALGVVGMTNQGMLHVLECFMERGMHPRDQINKYFELHFLYSCTHHGVESVAYQKALIHLLREEMFRLGKLRGPDAYFEITPILHGRTGKRERVEGVLAPRYKAGYITHQRRFALLEEQLEDWPNGLMDGPDVIAMAVTLLDPLAAFAYDPENPDEDKLAADQFEPMQMQWSAP